ncbi:MAG: hypothetical protein AB8F26_03520 [Phycisphaerales bacterium]
MADGRTIADRHVSGAAKFASRIGHEELEVRFLVDSESQVPRDHESVGPLRCRVERDVNPIRGVAGVLADSTQAYRPDDYVVVLNGAQVFREPLDELITSMLRTQADVAMVAGLDGTPVGLWLLRCAPLQTVRDVGYVDLKEQALLDWRGQWDIRVIERQRSPALRTRSVNEYLNGVRLDAIRQLSNATIDEDPYREEWERSFGVVEPNTDIAPDAVIHDSVILAGASIGKGAVVVRSVVCPGARVAPGERVAGRVVTATVKGRS